MDRYPKLRRPVGHQSNKHRRYRQPIKPTKPAAEETLQKLLSTVVDLSKMVKSAVDFYIYRYQPVDIQLMSAAVAVPPTNSRDPLGIGRSPVAVALPHSEPRTIPTHRPASAKKASASAAVELSKRDAMSISTHQPTSTENALYPVKVELSNSDPMQISHEQPEQANTTSVQNKRCRSPDSSSNSDDEDDLYIEQKDALAYVLIPGARRSGQLMYVLAEKNLYVRRYSFQNYEQYDCKVPQCRCTVQLTKPGGVARRISNRTATHQHAHMEDEYMELVGKPIEVESSDDGKQAKIKRTCVSQLTSANNMFVRLTDCSRITKKTTSTTRAKSPTPTVSGSRDAKSDDTEIDQHVWEGMLNIEIDDETMENSQPTPTGSTDVAAGGTCDPKSEIEINEQVWAEMLSIEECHEISDMEAEFTTYRETYDEDATAGGAVNDDDEQPDDGDSDGDDENMRYEFVAGRRICSQLLYTLDEKQLYRRKQQLPEYARYICMHRSCGVVLRLNARDKSLHRQDKSKQHRHSNAEETYLANKFLNIVKQDILNSDETPEKIYKTHAEKNASIAKLVPFNQLNCTMRKHKSRAKLRTLFKSPDTLAGVAAAFQNDATFETFGRSRSVHEPRSDFYRGTVDETEFGFSVFASATVVQHIVQSPAADRHYHVDGLVDLLPIGEYKELLIVYLEHKDCLYPVVYALLTKRCRRAYDALFEFIEERICNLAPVSIMCDYDFPLRNALRHMYPHCMRQPSHFQLVKAALRYALRLPQFFDVIHSDATQCRVFHKLLHLPVLPAELMVRGFKLVCAEASTFGNSFRLFVEYVYNAWIVNPGGPISVIGSESSSAKLIESYDAILRSKIRPARTFFHYIDELGNNELQRAGQLQSLSTGSGDVEADKPKKTSRHWNNIVKFQRQLLSGKMKVADFLDILTNKSNSLNITWDDPCKAQRIGDSEDEDDGNAAKEINRPLCEECGAAEQRKIVLQPCGHVWNCHQCYEGKSRNREIACPNCETVATGHLRF